MVQKPFSADHWRFSSPAVMFGVAILIAVVTFAIWKNVVLRHKSQLQLPPMQLRYQHPNLRSNSSHLFNHRCLSNNRRRRRILSKIQLSIFQSQRPLSSFTPNQREGIMSFFTVLFRTLDFTCTFLFHFVLHFFISCLNSL